VFATQAHSFTQQARLAITLAWIAGFTNTVSILALGTVTSHVSGTASQLGKAAAERQWSIAGFELYLLAVFMLGAMLAGVSMEVGKRRGWESIYVLPIALEAGLLAAFAFGLELYQHQQEHMGPWRYVFIAFAAGAMGLQNATITRISSGVVRTTHVTGVLTDLGTEIVQFLYVLRDAAIARLRGLGTLGSFVMNVQRHQASRRVVLLASIVGSFALGAGLGALAYDSWPRFSMFPPVLFLLWIIAQDVRRPIAEIAPADVVSAGELDLPDSIGVYTITRAAKSPVVRMPNLQAWTDRLPDRVHIAILELRNMPMLDENALAELASAMLRLHQQHRRLIVSGITPDQYQALRAIGAEEVIGPESLVPDMEFALVRALVLHDAQQRAREAP
jgi:uncharacterized membrane protein YoaK (UPF0700 family)